MTDKERFEQVGESVNRVRHGNLYNVGILPRL